MNEDCLIAVTAGDVAGIGPEIIVRAFTDARLRDACCPVLIGHPVIFRQAADLIGRQVPLRVLSMDRMAPADFRSEVRLIRESGELPCWNPSDDAVLSAPRGHISGAAGDAAFQYLISAISLARSGCVDGISTAPLNKEALHLSGHHYPGHTEILAEKCEVSEFAMMLHLPESAIAPWRTMVAGAQSGTSGRVAASHGISIVHVTLHTSIASVPGQLTEEAIVEKVRLMADFLSRIQCPRRSIAVCALNPHGGENGLFGDEEVRLIKPAVQRCQTDSSHICGPLPADTLIRRAIAGEFDGVVAMYHDQGHIPIKLIGFDAAVNITLGLPVIRTSPTHGTAFDRAWKAETPADPSGMIEAVRMAILLAAPQNARDH